MIRVRRERIYPCIHQFQHLRIDPFIEEALAAAQDNGVEHEAILVDETVLHQGVDELAATSE